MAAGEKSQMRSNRYARRRRLRIGSSRSLPLRAMYETNGGPAYDDATSTRSCPPSRNPDRVRVRRYRADEEAGQRSQRMGGDYRVGALAPRHRGRRTGGRSHRGIQVKGAQRLLFFDGRHEIGPTLLARNAAMRIEVTDTKML